MGQLTNFSVLQRYQLLLCFLLLGFAISLSSSQALKAYGESCDADCDERQLLTCSKNTSICECMRPTSMIYDADAGKCVGIAGLPCVRYSNDFLCAPYAHCNRTSQICNCDKGYFQTENGTCSLMAKYGDVCSSKRPCDRNSGMACVEKTAGASGSGRSRRTCQCMYPTDQVYDPTSDTCISFAGGNCSFNWPCVRNAHCSEDIYELRHGENLHGKHYSYNVTVGRKCACVEGTTMSKRRQCLRTYQQPCDLESDMGNGGCNSEENLKCFDSSICLCSNPLSQIYDRAQHKCVYLVGARCGKEETSGGNDADTSADTATVCSRNAECNKASGVCECKPGYSSSPFLTCLKDFGTECGRRSGDNGSDGGTCNFYRGLSCHQTSGTCGCIDDDTLKYDANSKSCLSAVEGGPCGTFEYTGSGFTTGGEEVPNQSLEPATFTGGSNTGNGNHHHHYHPHHHHNNHNSSVSTTQLIPPMVVTATKAKGKVFRAVSRIQVKCASELECVNEFGEIMQSEGSIGFRKESLFQGFCRRKH